MKTIYKKINVQLVAISFSSLLIGHLIIGCNATNTTKGGAIGVGAGGALGGIIGSQSGNTAIGAIIGATVGGATGALIGKHMDNQAEELKRDLHGAHVERVGEGIKITFNSGLLFNTNSSELKADTEKNLRELAKTLNKYNDTKILIEGHTDDVGSDTYNQTLSEQRANAVSSFLISQSVSSSRLSTVGYGETQPIGENSTELGREKNRRVEVAIFADKKMKRLAEKNQLGTN